MTVILYKYQFLVDPAGELDRETDLDLSASPSSRSDLAPSWKTRMII